MLARRAETPDLDELPSAEEIAEQFERFLRDQGKER